MKTYIKPAITIIAIENDTPLMAGSALDLNNSHSTSPQLSKEHHQIDDSWADSGSIWDEE